MVSNERGTARAISKAAIAVAVCVNVAFKRHYVDAAPSIKACRRCYLASTRALDLARYAYSEVGEGKGEVDMKFGIIRIKKERTEAKTAKQVELAQKKKQRAYKSKMEENS